MHRLTLITLLFTACGTAATAENTNDATVATDVTADVGVDVSTDATTTTLPTPTESLPAACGVAGPQFCNPLDGHGCAVGQTCDLAGDGTWQCFATDGAAEGATCDGLQGPFCATGLTCGGTQTAKAVCAKLCCDQAACKTGTCTPLHGVGASAGNVGACVVSDPGTVVLGNQPGRIQGRGHVVTWKPWREAVALQMAWYATACDDVGGYPLLASATHWNGDCDTTKNDEVIPAMQDGTALLSYVGYDAFTAHQNPQWLKTARGFGDYLIKEAVTPSSGLWPGVFRSTGAPTTFPLPPDCGIRSDQPYEIEPDKLGIAALGLVQLADATGDKKYLDAALHQAIVLAANIQTGDAVSSPWPFRVDWRDGLTSEPISGNMVYNLRLFDALIAKGHTELEPQRKKLWTWMRDVQIPNAAGDGTLWGEFFEDWTFQVNRTAWSPLSTASYLLEKREAIDPDWKKHADILLTFVEHNYVDIKQGFPLCIEQDFDRKPFGGILSTYAAAEARWAALTGDSERRSRAYLATALLIQTVGNDGCPADRALGGGCGGWQEDAQTDRVHNLLTVFMLFPDWGK